MGKTSNQIVDEGRKSMVRSIHRVNKLMRHALKGVTPEQFALDMQQNQKEAPLLAHIAGKAFVAQMKIDAQTQPPMHVGLSVTVIGKAGSMAEWQAMLQPNQRPPELAARLGVIDVIAENVPSVNVANAPAGAVNAEAARGGEAANFRESAKK